MFKLFIIVFKGEPCAGATFSTGETALLIESSSRVEIYDQSRGQRVSQLPTQPDDTKQIRNTCIVIQCHIKVSLVSEGNTGCTVLLGVMLVGGGGDGR